MGLEFPVMFKFHGKTDYFERLDKLIKSSETARMALRLESRGDIKQRVSKTTTWKTQICC